MQVPLDVMLEQKSKLVARIRLLEKKGRSCSQYEREELKDCRAILRHVKKGIAERHTQLQLFTNDVD